MGEVPDAYEFMSQHSIMIVPLLAGGGMRIKILEGLSYGKVIVSTSIGAEGISAENGKEICIADTLNEFVSAIQAIISQPETIDEISRNAQNFITRCFDNSLIIKNLIEEIFHNIKSVTSLTAPAPP